MSVFSFPDFANHEQVVFGSDEESGLKAIIAVHNTNLGPSLGGCRVFDYANEDDALSDVLRLSQGMTYKSALAGLPLGGGKAVIIGEPKKIKSRELFVAMGRLVDSLGGRYISAQDSGTSVDDLKIMATQTKHVAGSSNTIDTRGRNRSGDPSPATAYGVFVGLKAAVRHRLKVDSLRGIRIAVQGVGNVGFGLAKQLFDEGAELVVSDVNADNLQRAQSELNASVVEGDAIYAQDVDVFAPCALGGAVNEKSFEMITAPVIAGAANNQLLTEDMGKRLHERGTLYAPDYVINAGGIIHIHYMRTDQSWQAATEHVGCIATTLSEIFTRSEAQNLCTSDIANQLAEERFMRKVCY